MIINMWGLINAESSYVSVDASLISVVDWTIILKDKLIQIHVYFFRETPLKLDAIFGWNGINTLRPNDAICVSNRTIIVSDNGLSPGRRQAIIWTNAGI